MKIAVLFLSLFLVACCKKENPPRRPVPPVNTDTVTCHTVKILKVTEEDSLLEIVGDGPQFRMLRSGVFGDVGDVFKFCEKD